ncbi:hypothetical protein C8R46DRAFT_1206023 [Mycena filopes]|nr:hypothetical protein C8R46DRAFT_1206023 [Mycena filopes]
MKASYLLFAAAHSTAIGTTAKVVRRQAASTTTASIFTIPSPRVTDAVVIADYNNYLSVCFDQAKNITDAALEKYHALFPEHANDTSSSYAFYSWADEFYPDMKKNEASAELQTQTPATGSGASSSFSYLDDDTPTSTIAAAKPSSSSNSVGGKTTMIPPALLGFVALIAFAIQ